MATNNDNTPINPSSDLNQVEVKVEKNKFSLVFLITGFFLILLAVLVIYVLYNQVSKSQKNENTSTVIPTLVENMTTPETELFSIPVYYWIGSTEPSYTLQVMAPSGSVLTESERSGLPAQILSFPDDTSLVFFANHGGGSQITFDLESLTRIEIDNNGDLYRYNNDGVMSYLRVQTEGICVETLDGDIVAPCGYPGSGFVCESNTGDYTTCDETMKTISELGEFL